MSASERPQRPQSPPELHVAIDPQADQVGEDADRKVFAAFPWMVSAMAHAGLILLTMFVIFAIQVKPDETVVIPEVGPNKQPNPSIVSSMTPQSSSSTGQPAKHRSVSAGANAGPDLLSATVGSGGNGLGLVSFDSSPGPMGTFPHQATEFGSNFFGTSGEARKIAYVIDASGSLIDTMTFVLDELARSISELSEKQQVVVVFFAGGKVVQVPPQRWVHMAQANKRAMLDWIDIDAGNVIAFGPTDPVAALETAMRMRPDLVYLLSDNITGSGRYEVDQRQLLRTIADLNVRTRINTIQFIYPDPLTKVGLESTLALIASQSGGDHRFVSARDLRIAP